MQSLTFDNLHHSGIESQIIGFIPELQRDFTIPIYENNINLLKNLEKNIVSFIENNPKCITSEIIDNFPEEEISNIIEILNKLESDPQFVVKTHKPE